MKAFFSTIFKTCFFCFFLCVAFTISLLTTEVGSRWFASQIAHFSKGQIHYHDFQGTWWHDFTIQDLQLHLSHQNILIHQAHVQWHISFFPFMLYIDQAKFDQIQLQTANQKTFSADIFLQALGTIKQYQWQLMLQHIHLPQAIPLSDLQLKGEGTLHSLSVTQILSDQWPKTLHITALYQWKPFINMHIALQGQVDPGLWSKNWAGELNTHVQLSWQKNSQGEQIGALILDQLNGNLRGQSIAGHGELAWADDHLSWKDWQLKIGQANVNINGILSGDSQLHWTIDVPQLSWIWPTLSGKIQSQGNLNGDWQNPRLSAFLQAQNIKMPNFYVQLLSLQASNQSLQRPSFVLHAKLQQLISRLLTLNTLQLNANGSMQQQNIQLSLQGNYQVTPDFRLPIQVNQTMIQTQIQNNQAAAKFNLQSNLLNVNGKIVLPAFQKYLNGQWRKQPLEAHIEAQLRRFDLFFQNLPAWQKAQGMLDAKLDAQGSFNQPQLNVLAHLHDASVYWVTNNLTFTPIDLTLQGDLLKVLKVNGWTSTGAGRLFAQGQIQSPMEDANIQINLKGDQILASNLFAYKIWITPNIDLHYHAPDFSLSGNLLIPKADLNFTDYSDNVQTLSSDIVYANEASTNFNFASSLLLRLGSDIHLTYGGLSGRLTGQLQLNQANTNATANGAINLIDGRYKAYGQKLSIQKGMASYNNTDVANPELNIQAVKVLHNMTSLAATSNYISGAPPTLPDGRLIVGVEITGPLLNHHVNLFSQPVGLSQSDILSYLVLGIPASQAGSAGGPLLMTVASALGGNSQGNTVERLQQQLQNTLGIEVNVGTVSQYNPQAQSTTDDTALILTKALSPRLYISYSAAVAQNANIFKVRYQLTRSWMAQTESSELGNGGDIFYTIDR